VGVDPSSGTISGVPQQTGYFPFTLRVADSTPAYVDATTSITVGSNPAALRACDFFGMASVGRGVEGDGEGRGAGWERVRGVLEINFSGFPQIFYKLPRFSCWYLLIHAIMPVWIILYIRMICS
jgi:hypothetical protein